MEQLAGTAAGAGPARPERRVTTLEIAGIPVEFPFEPYSCQRDFMESVIKALQEGKNALLESPTGTGKTLCLLCSALAWRESLKPPAPDTTAAAAAALAAQAGLMLPPGAAGMGNSQVGMPPGGPPGQPGGKPDLPLIIYSSRTHSQLAQVMKELRNSSYKDRVRSSVLSSRQQTCLHPTASKLTGGAVNQACKALVAAKKCSFHNQLKYGKYRNAASSLVGPVPDIEELVAVGKAHGVCPFYLGRDAGKDADIVFLPYNYLLDPNTRRTLADNINWNNAVVIFDEAHNVESVSSDACSFDITAKQLTDAMLEAKRCKEVCLENIERGMVAMVDVPAPGETGGPDYRRLAADMDLLLGVLKLLENGLHSLAAKLPPPPSHGGNDSAGLTRPGSFLFEFLAQFGITAHSLSALNAAMDSASDILAAAEVDAGRTSAKAAAVALQHLQSSLNLAFSTLEPLSDKPGAPPAHKGFRVHVHLQRSWGADKLPAPTLSYWCFIPGMAFRRLASLRLRSFLLTSGTLSPLDSFAAELQIPFPIRLENPHIIAASQVWVGVLPTGPSGAALNSTFASRDSAVYKDELGNALVNLARLVPDGLLVFFASYAAMDSALQHWKQNGGAGGVGSTWERIVRHKAPVVEPRESAQFGAAIDEFRSKLDDPATQGAVFFAVCRGKVSEGLDFSDRAGRAVVITGIPYAVKNDPKVRLKRDVLDEEARAAASGHGMAEPGTTTLNGEAWYTNTAMRAVNQAMGRVIRHRWDYGAILLADDRFRNPGTQRGMSRWLREHVAVYDQFGRATASLTKFFKDKAGFQAPAKVLPGRSTAFEAVSAAPSAPAAGAYGGAGKGFGAGGRSLLESAPAAIDVSGIGALTSRGLGGGSSGRGARAGAPAQAGAGADGAGKKAGGGLLGLLRSAPPAADGASAAAGSGSTRAVAGADGGHSGGAGAGAGAARLDAAISSLAAGSQGGPTAPKASGPGRPGAPVPAAGGRPTGLPPRPTALGMLALAGGLTSAAATQQAQQAQRPAPAGAGAAGSGSGPSGGEVVGPRHKLEELRRRATSPEAAAERAAAGASQASPESPDHGQGPGDEAAGRTAGGLTRIVLRPVQPAAEANGAPTQGSGGHVQSSQAAHAAGGAGAGKEGAGGGAPAAKADPRAFMAQLKTDLSPDAFKQFQALMSDYKTSKNLTAFVDGAVELLHAPRTAHLLQGVAAFMPKAERDWFNKVIQVHMRGAAGAHAGPAHPAGEHTAQGAAQRPAGEGRREDGGGAAGGQAQARAHAPAGPGPAGPRADADREAAAAAARRPAVGGVLGKRPAPSDAAAAASASVAALSQQQGRGATQSKQGANAPAAAVPRQPDSGKARVAAAAALSAVASLPAGGSGGLGAQLARRPAGATAGPGSAGATPSLPQQGQSTGMGCTASGQQQGRGAAPAKGAAVGGGTQAPPSKRPNTGGSGQPSAAGGNALSSRDSRPASAPAAGARGAGVLSSAAAATPCGLCGKRPMDNAHEGPCGHVACYNCWLVQLAVHFKCKTCARPMRQKNLTKKYFM